MLCLGKIFENPESNDTWEQRQGQLKSSQDYRNFDRIDGEPIQFEWNIFPGFKTLQLNEGSQKFTVQIVRNTLFMSMFNDISCGTQDNEKECLTNARLVSLYARRFRK